MGREIMVCPTCGAPRDKTVSRGGLIVHHEPLRVNYRGARLPLTRSQAQVVEKLVRFGRAHFDILEGDAGRKALRVVIAQLRKLLPEPARITSIPGWGYELTIEKD